MLANGIAIYGGHDNTVTGNLVVDTGITQGGGIQVGAALHLHPGRHRPRSPTTP